MKMTGKVENLEVKLMNSYPNVLKTLWVPARNCYYRGNFEELDLKYNKEDAIKLLQGIYKKGHLSIFEMASFQFQVTGMSRSCLAQLTRHRIGFSYAVQSQHFQKHDDFNFKDLEQYSNDEQKQEYYKLMESINIFYKKAMADGLPRYIAREVLPNSCSVHLVLSANLRALDNFWKLRKEPVNTPEIQKFSQMLYRETEKGFPELNQIIQY